MCEYIHFCTLTLYLKTTYSTLLTLLTVKRRSMKFLARLGFSRHPNINTTYFHHKYYQRTYFTPVSNYFSKIVYLRNICLSKN